VHLKDILENHFGVKVYVNNDANCFAIGEKYFGNAKDYENVIGLILGTGVGAGIIFKGHLYSGTNCGAGELGSLPYREHDFEHYCSKSYFELKYGMKFELLYKRALNNDKIALAVFEQYGYDLGNLIKTILYTTDPEIIILGGTIAKAFPFFEKTMRNRVKTFIYKHSLKKLKIIPSQQLETAIFGAVALFFDAQNITLKK
jgi:glucokinase